MSREPQLDRSRKVDSQGVIALLVCDVTIGANQGRRALKPIITHVVVFPTPINRDMKPLVVLGQTRDSFTASPLRRISRAKEVAALAESPSIRVPT